MKQTIKLHGLKKAIGDYRRANAEGGYSPRYGRLMLDTADGEIWTDEFYDLGHGERKVYHSNTIINLGREMGSYNIVPTMTTVKEFCAKHYGIG